MVRRPSGWSAELAWATANLASSGFGTALYILNLPAAVYHIWAERNAHIFTSKERDVDTVFKNIEREVRNRCCSWDLVDDCYSNWLMCLSWNIPTKILKVAGH